MSDLTPTNPGTLVPSGQVNPDGRAALLLNLGLSAVFRVRAVVPGAAGNNIRFGIVPSDDFLAPGVTEEGNDVIYEYPRRIALRVETGGSGVWTALEYAGQRNGQPSWTEDGEPYTGASDGRWTLSAADDQWLLIHHEAGSGEFSAEVDIEGRLPDEIPLGDWFVEVGSGMLTIEIAPQFITAQDVMDEIDANATLIETYALAGDDEDFAGEISDFPLTALRNGGSVPTAIGGLVPSGGGSSTPSAPSPTLPPNTPGSPPAPPSGAIPQTPPPGITIDAIETFISQRAVRRDEPNELTTIEQMRLLMDLGAARETRIDISLRGAIADGTSHPVSEWVTAGRYASLSAIQADYPHVTELTDEIDWAVIQGELDKVNTGDTGSYGARILLPLGHYICNKQLRLHGPGMILEGVNRLITWIEFTEDLPVAVQYAARNNSGGQRVKFAEIRQLTLQGVWDDEVEGVGVSTLTPLGGEQYWMAGLLVDSCNILGFGTGFKCANLPLAFWHNCQVTNREWNWDMIKVDSWGVLNCDGNAAAWGREGDRPSAPNPRNRYNSCINFRVRPTTPNFTNDPTGNQNGGTSFAGYIQGGEYGQGKAMMEITGGRVRISDVNVENCVNPWVIRMAGPSFVALSNFRYQGLPENTSLIEAEPSGSGSCNILLDQVIFNNRPEGVPHVRFVGTNYNGGLLDSRERVRVKWVDGTDGDQGEWIGAGRIKHRSYRLSTISDTNAGNEILRGEPLWYNRHPNFSEDLLTGYEGADGVFRRSSLLNHRLARTISQTAAEVASTAGTRQDAVVTTVPVNTLQGIGDSLEIEYWGRFAANANNKAVQIALQGYQMDPAAAAHNDKGWHLKVRFFRRGSGQQASWIAELIIEGQSPIINVGTANTTMTAERTCSLRTTGADAGDVIVHGGFVNYRKGDRN